MVDPEAAEVVKRIFAMTIEGYGPYQIASNDGVDSARGDDDFTPVSYTHLV